MNRFLKVISSFVLIAFFAGCGNDDNGADIPPPRDYAVQYATEKVAIEDYLHTHYISGVDADMNITIAAIPEGGTQESIWDQDQYPLLNKQVTANNVDYTIYYLSLREGVGEAPTKYDNVSVAYRGMLLDGTEFDNRQFPGAPSALLGVIEGWQEIIPLFKTGIYIDIPGSPDPATFQDFGAGVMFLPSDFGYYEGSRPSIPAYSPLIFSFKLYQLEREDHDEDGILTNDETVAGTDPADYDTDGDGTVNFLDIDDDNDGTLTKVERQMADDGDPLTPVQYYTFDMLPTCPGGTLKRHLDPNCFED